MGVRTYWDDEVTNVICIEAEGKWTLDEFTEGITLVCEMLDTVKARVDLIGITTPDTTPPSNFAFHFRNAAAKLTGHPNMHTINVITDNTLIKIVVMSIIKILHLDRRVIFAHSREHAYEVIRMNRKFTLKRNAV